MAFGMVIWMQRKVENMTQMSLFESAFGIWYFLMKIMCGDVESGDREKW